MANTVNVKWAADYGETSNMFPKQAPDILFSGKGWVVGIWLVEKLSSEQVITFFWEYYKSDCPLSMVWSISLISP